MKFLLFSPPFHHMFLYHEHVYLLTHFHEHVFTCLQYIFYSMTFHGYWASFNQHDNYMYYSFHRKRLHVAILYCKSANRNAITLFVLLAHQKSVIGQ